MSTWAAVADVTAITGITVAADKVAMANGMVDLFVNRSQSASGVMSKRDLSAIQQAVAWQAVWLAGQVAPEQRQGATRIAQDGLLVIRDTPADVVLAPLAQRALKNVSWLGPRTTFPRRQWLNPDNFVPPQSNFTEESSDYYTTWDVS